MIRIVTNTATLTTEGVFTVERKGSKSDNLCVILMKFLRRKREIIQMWSKKWSYNIWRMGNKEWLTTMILQNNLSLRQVF